ncbi:hypothetical protein, partial [Leptospira interrogans]|uniref:hypothetical protein n=1 Tax=Leptospira interrogans TaxID=173 RepID=UPI001E522B65
NSDRFILRSNTCGVGDGWERDLSLGKRLLSLNAIWNFSKDRHFRKRFIEFKKRDSMFFERPLESVD